MAAQTGTTIPNDSPIVLADDQDDGYVADANHLKGGHYSVGTIVARDAIRVKCRRPGMTCDVEETGLTYVLRGGIANVNWVDPQAELKATLVKDQPLKLPRIKNAIAAYRTAGTGAASWLFYGDSISESFWSPESQLEFGRRYGLRGFWIDLGVQTYGTASIRFSSGISSGTTERLDGYALSPTGRTYVMTGAGQGVQFRPNAANVPDFSPDRYTLVYARQPGGGIFKVQTLAGAGGDSDAYWTDVAGMTSVDTANATLALATLVIPFATASTTNRVRCMWVSGGSTEIVGALCENTAAAGIVMSYLSKGGLDMSQTAAISSANLGVLLGVMKPDLIHWAMKDTDLAAKLVSHQALWDAAYPTAWLYTTPYPSESQTEQQVRIEADKVIAHARANGHEYWDSLVYLPNYQVMSAMNIATDGTHLNAQGALFMGPKIQRDTGLFPDAREGGQPASAPVFSSVTATDLVLSGRSQREANRDAATMARTLRGGIRIPSGVNAKIANTVPIPAVGTDSFTFIGFVKVPDTPVALQVLALRTSTAGTGNQNGTLVLSASSTTFRIVLRTSAGTTVNFGPDTLAPTFWAHAGKVVMVGIRRNMAAPADAAKFNLVIGADVFPANGPNTTDAGDTLAATYIIAGAIANSSVAYDLFGAAYYASALTDAQIQTIARSNVFPAGAVVQWDMVNTGSDTSAADRSGNNNPGQLLYGAVFTQPIASSGGGGAASPYDVTSLALARDGGVRVLSGTAGKVANSLPVSNVGTGSFTMLAWVRVPDTPGNLDLIGLRTTTNITNQNSTLVLCATATVFRALVRTSAGALVTFGTTAIGNAFWALKGKVVMVGVRRDTTTTPKLTLVIGDVLYPENTGGDTAASESLTATFFVAGAIQNNAVMDCSLFGAAYYASALTDAQIQEIARFQHFPAGAAIRWDMSYNNSGLGVADFSGNSNIGQMLSGATFTKPQLNAGYAYADDARMMTLSRQGGVRVPSGVAGRVISDIPFTAVGSGSFTCLMLVRLPETPGAVDLLALRTSTGGGNSQNGTVLLSASSTLLQITLRTSAGTNHIFGSAAIGSALWAYAGKVVMVGMRRDMAATPKISLVVAGTAYPDNAGGDTAASDSLLATYFAAGAVTGAASADYEMFGAAYYSGALTDAQVQAIAATGAFPSGAVSYWDMVFTPGTGVTDFSGNKNIGRILGGAPWSRPRYPFITKVPGNSVTSEPWGDYQWIAPNANANTTALPTTARAGDRVRHSGWAQGVLTITQASGQSITDPTGATAFDPETGQSWSTASTTTGTGGSLVFANRYSTIELECMDDNSLSWKVVSKNGKFTIV